MTRASRFIAVLADALPPERYQHGRIERAAEQVADANGGIGRPYTVATTLDRMLQDGDITPAQHLAGNIFANWFALAGLDSLRAGDLGQRVKSGRSLGAGIEHARRQVNAALDALGGLGSPCGSACWHILGMQESLAAWARREGWGGRPIRRETARWVFIGGLSVLVSHFRA